MNPSIGPDLPRPIQGGESDADRMARIMEEQRRINDAQMQPAGPEPPEINQIICLCRKAKDIGSAAKGAINDVGNMLNDMFAEEGVPKTKPIKPRPVPPLTPRPNLRFPTGSGIPTNLPEAGKNGARAGCLVWKKRCNECIAKVVSWYHEGM